ncbi:hypothetical protein HYV81_02700 [Candidatus Woesearchaeota archaeon]|nr:hypothetical protein [Candidatus Woesearchaeota archaeon]
MKNFAIGFVFLAGILLLAGCQQEPEGASRDGTCFMYRSNANGQIDCFRQNEVPSGWSAYTSTADIPYTCFEDNGACVLGE